MSHYFARHKRNTFKEDPGLKKEIASTCYLGCNRSRARTNFYYDLILGYHVLFSLPSLS